MVSNIGRQLKIKLHRSTIADIRALRAIRAYLGYHIRGGKFTNYIADSQFPDVVQSLYGLPWLRSLFEFMDIKL